MKRLCLLGLTLFATLGSLGLLSAANPSQPNTLTAAEKKDGWKLLFDGKDLSGWHVWKHTGTQGWEVKDGAICLEKPGSGDLVTDAKYGNFEFSVDWKFEKRGNSGIIYRVGDANGPTWVTGPEMQIESEGPKSKLGKNSTGSLYDVFAPSSNTLKGPEEWNNFKIVANGKHLEQWVNGTKVVDTEIGSEEWNQAIAKSKWKGSKQFASEAAGYLALQDHGAKICFRNLKIKELPGSDAGK